MADRIEQKILEETLEGIAARNISHAADSRRKRRIAGSIKSDWKRDFLSGQSLEAQKRIVDKLKEEYRKRLEPLLDVGSISGGYCVNVMDQSVDTPFIASPYLVRVLKRYTEGYTDPEQKARAIFDWMQNNIQYGTESRRNGYKNSKETLETGEGICVEMAYVYIVMARCCGLGSQYASVTVDFQGKKVHHGCAAVRIEKRDLLVDPAYHMFDVAHRKYKILPDSEVLEMFNQWRRG